MNYLIALNLQNKPVLVVGGGQVATHKIADLLLSSAKVTVISPTVTDILRTHANHREIVWQADEYNVEILDMLNPVLVIAATSESHINSQVAYDARQRRMLVNNVTDAADSDFHNLAQIVRDPIQIGISTGGASPLLSKMLKSDIEAVIDEATVTLAQWLADMREPVKQSLTSQQERHQLFQRILSSDILAQLRSGQRDVARQSLDNILETVL